MSMSSILSRAISTLVLTLSCQAAFGMGASVGITKIDFLSKGSPYTGLGQMTREMRATGEDNIVIDYTLNGEQRVLWDDDGFATLYLYQRSLVSSVFNKEITEGSPLPQPIAPALKALDMLKSTYQAGGRSDIAARIDSVSRSLQRGRVVGDIRTSGLESLINDLVSNHTYKLEVGKDKSIRKKIDELIGVGAPITLTDTVSARCRDSISLNWNKAVGSFTTNQPSNNSEGLPSRGVR